MKTKQNISSSLMKNIFLLLLLFTGIVEAQIVNIPDANFKAKLLTASPSNSTASNYNLNNNLPNPYDRCTIDLNNDNEIDLSEAATITFLDVTNSNISNLQGIEAFVNLKFLYCYDNQLTSLNLTSNTNMISIICSNNQISGTLNLSSMPNLLGIACAHNQISNINLSGLTALQTILCSSNPISTIDTSNLVNLNSLVCDSTSITTLNLTNNSNLVQLIISNNAFTAINLSGLTNLEQLYCSSNQFNSLDVSSLSALKYVDCSNNQITSLNLSNSTAIISIGCNNNVLTSLTIPDTTTLTTLYANNNQLTTINFGTNPNLNFINCSFNAITSINIASLTGLFKFYASDNQISTINLTTNTALTDIELQNNFLTALDASNNVNLISLQCPFNNISSLNISNLNNLKTLYCGNNQLSSLDISSIVNIETFDYAYNSLPNLDFTNLTHLRSLRNSFNQITSLDMATVTGLKYLYCDGNLIPIIDVSSLTSLIQLSCGSPSLTSLFVKNGINYGVSIANSPNLVFVCADELEIVSIQNQANFSGNGNFTVNSYCTFFPGGNYNTINGTLTFDANNNGCDALDVKHPNIKVTMNDTTVTSDTFTSSLGTYGYYVSSGSYVLSPQLENPTYFTVDPTTTTCTFPTVDNSTQTKDFCIVANGVHHDLEVVLFSTSARPGFGCNYQLVFRNKGTETLSGAVNVTFDDARIDFALSLPNPDSQSVNLLSWNFNDLQPFESRSIPFVMLINSPLQTPPVNIGDLLNFQASITPVIGDEIPNDNLFTFNQTVVGSYDPNDITCIEGAVVAPTEIGNYLHYAINFENTGTFPAENVVVKTEVDAAKFDIGSLQLMNSNFPVDARITGNNVEFIFENIQLPIGGHGHILLKIKTQNTLVTGDAVANRADIYFDYNFPVDTGLENTVFQTLSNTDFDIDESVVVAPNPALNMVTVKANNNIKSIQLYDVQGRIISTSLVDALESKLDISSDANGIYFIKIITQKGIKVQKLFKK